MVSIAGAIDIHVHAGPEVFRRIGDAVDIARRAADAGMGGLVFKCHHEPSVTRAILAAKDLPFLGLWGGITLNAFVGGINPVAVAQTLESGGRIVWMPTMHARNHIQLIGAGTYGIPAMTLKGDAAISEGISVLDTDGQLTQESRRVIELVNLYGATLATGHLGEEEIKALVGECVRTNTRCVVTHAFFPRHRAEFLVEMAQMGAWIEVSAVVAFPMARHFAGGMELAQVRDLIKAVGEERIVISTDSGQIHNPWPPDVLQSFVNMVCAVGIPEDAVREMITTQPRRILGLDDTPETST